MEYITILYIYNLKKLLDSFFNYWKKGKFLFDLIIAILSNIIIYAFLKEIKKGKIFIVIFKIPRILTFF